MSRRLLGVDASLIDVCCSEVDEDSGSTRAASSAAEFMKNPRTPGAAKEAQAIFGLAKKAFKK